MFLDLPVSAAYHVVTWLASATGVALAIVVFTVCVRVLLLPLGAAAARGDKARAKLMPRIQRLRERYRDNPRRLHAEIARLQQESGTSMFAGCLPMLVQIPFFMVLYRLFSSSMVSGQANTLLDGTLLGAPLGQHFLTAGPHQWVFLGLFALLAVVAWVSARWQAKHGPGPAALRLLPYGTMLVAAVVPLAAGLYLLVTNTWSVVERAVFYG
ncbi:MAG TPA: membrane protein insertase YidC [Amycolatopsis sp.]|uniref:YidC/Oxa1 family membrane protein insertase n=1 Tax=Amycolatopsis sp. TaxID=37632 RepID=UPI002B491447|nr:membrane protein insertase YidC [Amycolatopsis sp.]HKS49521.1 membrane protein insertase YidC [Amycolatopsis sp.]